jgi:hypothetical protein
MDDDTRMKIIRENGTRRRRTEDTMNEKNPDETQRKLDSRQEKKKDTIQTNSDAKGETRWNKTQEVSNNSLKRDNIVIQEIRCDRH